LCILCLFVAIPSFDLRSQADPIWTGEW